MSEPKSIYMLPSGDAESQRLSTQHVALVLLFGGLFPPHLKNEVEHAMKLRKDGNPPLIMDIGTGTGDWAVEVARLYPSAKVIGLDERECHAKNVPGNLTFVQENAMHGLGEYRGKASIMHCRAVAGHVMDPSALVKYIGECLIPGGLFLLGDANYRAFTEKNEPYEPADIDGTPADNEGKSWFGRLLALKRDLSPTKDTNTAGGEGLLDLLSRDPQFQSVGSNDYFSPMYWDDDSDQSSEKKLETQIAQFHVKTGIAFANSCSGLMKSSGMSDETVARVIDNIIQEITVPTKRIRCKWSMAWAVKA